MPVSAILLNWKRPWNMPVITNHLKDTGLIDDVIVFDNSGELEGIDGATVIHSDENMGTYGRRLAARYCRHEVAYVQDDDYRINNVQQIIEAFMNKPDHIAAALSPGHYKHEAGKKPWLQMGWGCVQKREWLVNTVKSYIERYGVDDLLKSKFDRIHTVLHGKHNPLRSDFTALRNPDGVESDKDFNSLWLQRKHYQLRDQAVERAIELRDNPDAGSV